MATFVQRRGKVKICSSHPCLQCGQAADNVYNRARGCECCWDAAFTAKIMRRWTTGHSFLHSSCCDCLSSSVVDVTLLNLDLERMQASRCQWVLCLIVLFVLMGPAGCGSPLHLPPRGSNAHSRRVAETSPHTRVTETRAHTHGIVRHRRDRSVAQSVEFR